MQSSHALATVDIAFEDANLIGDAGLRHGVALAESIGLSRLVTDQMKIIGIPADHPRLPTKRYRWTGSIDRQNSTGGTRISGSRPRSQITTSES